MMKPVALLAATFILCASPPACAEGDSSKEATGPMSMADILRDAMAGHDVPGMGAVVASSGGLIDLEVAGVRQSNTGSPLEPGDPFHIGSVAKTFTATVIAKLVQSGRLQWDTPVAEVLPEVMVEAHGAFEGVTLAQLLSHEAGLQPMEEDAELELVPELTGDIKSRRRQFARWIFQQDPAVTPFTEYRYSNAHFVVAASMAETVTGKSWEGLVKEHIFAPLHMSKSGFGWPGKLDDSAPWGHTFRDGGLQPVDPNGEYQLPQYFAPAGDIHASLPDMARYFQAYLASWNAAGNFLGSDTLRLMWTRRLRSGLGWGVTEAFGFETVAMYSGSADTFLMIIVLIPQADIGVAVVANAYSEDVETAVVEALRAIVDLYTASNGG